MLGKAATPRLLLPRSSRGFSQSPSSPGSAKTHRKPGRARPKQPQPLETSSYSRLGTENSLLRFRTASNYYSPHGEDSRPTMDQPNMQQPDGFMTQAMKENRRRQNQQDMAQGRGSFYQSPHQYASGDSGVGGVGHLAHGFQQQTAPMWTPIDSHMGSNRANTAMRFQGPPMQNSSNPFNMNPAQSPMSSGFPAQFFTPNAGTHLGIFDPSFHPGWPSAGASQNRQHANNSPFFDNQLASFAQQNGVWRTPIPAEQASSVPKMPVVKANKSAADQRHRLEITAPSKRSGGVPDPTDAYLMRASFLPKRRSNPGPLLVVIDLNGTLLYRPSRKNSTSFQSRRHAKEFVTYCAQTFWVVFWSSAKPENVQGMVNQLLSEPLRKQVVGVWGRDKFGLTEQDYNKRTQCYKRLTKLWKDPVIKSTYPSQRPGFEGGCWDQGNTVLIDDSVEKARSEPHNAITLPEYLGGADDEGNVLPEVHDYLNELCYQEDVSAYMRAHPFKMS